MATAQQVIELVFNGIDKTGAATQSALSNLSSFSATAKDITQPVADFTAAAVKLEAGILAAGVAMVAFSVKAAGDFDTAFREIATLLDKPIDQLGDFRDAILKYASSSTAPLEQVTTAIYNAISAGVPLEQSIAAVATAEKLSIAGKAELNDTLRVLVSSLNAYGLGMDSADRFSDALFTTVRLGQTTLPELASSLSQVTGAAAAVGVPFETVLAALSTLTAAGTPTAQAVTQINSVLTALIKPSADASKLASELGIEFGAQAVKAKGLEGVLADVMRATGGNQEQMGRLFGSVEALKAVFPLTGASAEKFAGDLDAMRNSAGATEAAFSKMAGSVAQSNQQIVNALNGLFVQIGTPLLDEFGGIAQAIAGIFNALGASVKAGGLGTLVDYIQSIMGDLQSTLETVARNLPAALEKADFGGFKNGIDVVVEAIKKLFSGIDLSTVDGLAAAIQVVGAAFLGLSSYVAGVIESFKPLFDQLVKVGSGLADIDSGIFKTAGEIAGFVTQANLLAGGLNSLLPALEALVSLLVVKQAASLAGGLASAAAGAGALGTALGSAGLVAAAGAAGYGVGTLLVEPIDKLVSKLTGSQTTLGGWIYDLLNGGKAAEDMGTKTAGATAGVEKLEKSVSTASKAVADSKNPFEAANAAMLATYAASEKAAAGSQKLAEATGTASSGIKGVTTIIDAATGKIIGYEQANSKSAGSLTKVADETKKAEDATKKWAEEVAKMNFQEKLKLIESQTKVMTATIEAEAKKTVAAFESIGVTINSTGDVLSSLFGQFKDWGSMDWGAIRLIEDQIDKENKLRQDAFELQKDLTEAQIAQMKAQTDAILKGDGLIKIDGAGLQPHLEAFMWEILKTLQVKVNKDGLKMLLGV